MTTSYMGVSANWGCPFERGYGAMEGLYWVSHGLGRLSTRGLGLC